MSSWTIHPGMADDLEHITAQVNIYCFFEGVSEQSLFYLIRFKGGESDQVHSRAKKTTELAFNLLFDGSQDSRSKSSFINDLH